MTGELPFIHDVVIIGAGPCGLAVAARLREHTPSALFTEAEHNRYHWINKHTASASIKNSRNGAIRPGSGGFTDASSSSSSSPSMLVLDSSGKEWLAKWKTLFARLEITHLRSPMFFHPDPQDRDGLLAYAHSQGREGDCVEIVGCVGKEISKHQIKKKRKLRKAAHEQAKPPVAIDERDRKDYFTPPSDLFQGYCESIARRYRLQDESLIQHAAVSKLDYDLVPQLSPFEKFFTIQSDAGTFYARSVVLAVGAGNAPSIPKPFPQAPNPYSCHAFSGQDGTLSARLKARGQATNVLVIGGGLTSAQIADRALRRAGPNVKIHHVMRGPLKVKPFDVDLSWMGKFQNHEKASFWSADTDDERCDLVNAARGGGSVTPRYARVLQAHIAAGRLALHTHTVVTGAELDAEKGAWRIATEPERPDWPACFHFVYFATGVASDVSTLPFLGTINEKYPIPTYAGLPALNHDLMWDDDVPLFVTGRFAALRLGPGAGNLEGARLGAERVAWAVPGVLRRSADGALAGGRGKRGSLGAVDSVVGEDGEDDEKEEVRRQDGDDDGYRYRVGIGSRFQALAAVEA